MKILFKLKKIIEPRSINEDSRRREHILNIFLLGSIILTATALLILVLEYFIIGSGYEGAAPSILFVVFFSFSFLFILSKKGYYIISSYILIIIYSLTTIYTSNMWGIDVPQALLMYALIIVMSGVLISTRFAFLMTALISAFIISFTLLQQKGIMHPDYYWVEDRNPKIVDSLVYIFTYSVIVVVSWLSNREIENALKRAHRSEADLKKEKDMLEVKVEQRTEEIKKIQQEKMIQFNRFADMGRAAGGILHDIVNPLTSISLNLDKLNKESQHIDPNNLGEMRATVANALAGTKNLRDFTESLLKQLKHQEVKIKFDAISEIIRVIGILAYKSKKAGVEIELNHDRDARVEMLGDPLKFNQLIKNLVGNAIDAYDEVYTGNKKVFIRSRRVNGTVRIEVEDKGRGIKDDMQIHVFQPFFTTKSIDKGTGIGLSNSKDIIEKDFGGKISFSSKEGEGTIFILELPEL